MATSTTFDIYRYKEMKAGKRKVLVCGHDQKFWYPLQSHLEATGLFEFKEDYWPGHNDHDPKKTLEMMEWADIVVAEWALGNAVFCAKHKRDGQRLVTRLHLQERNTPYPAEIDYEKMDEVVFVGQHILEECVAKFPMPKEKVRVVGNFLDSKRFQQEKMGGNEFNLGMIGIVPSRKRLDLALDTLRLLLEKDERYTLHVKGASPQSYRWLMARTAEREYYTKIFETINSSDLRHKVVFDPAGDDVQRPIVAGERVDEAVERRHVLVEPEAARRERDVTRIDPVGHADVAVGEQHLDGFPHHHGRVAREWRAQQHRAPCVAAREAAQVAERRARDDPLVDGGALEIEARRPGGRPEQRLEQVVIAGRRGVRQRRGGPHVERVARCRAPGAHPFPLLLDDGIPHGEPWYGRGVNLHYGHSGRAAGVGYVTE
ncbi:glycosyltransferase [Burkholderia cepacia GG4]|uniref:Glycosyltransferase n=1 Tax=Burkholderia cepacia GG4 TaxID=1009846 RepID=A0A9W3K1P5_BURCE|nr:glycosyltransferase [Burkholderia cepacia GG4]